MYPENRHEWEPKDVSANDYPKLESDLQVAFIMFAKICEPADAKWSLGFHQLDSFLETV